MLLAVDVLGNREHDKQDDGEGDAVDSRDLLRKKIGDGGHAQQQGGQPQTDRDLDPAQVQMFQGNLYS